MQRTRTIHSVTVGETECELQHEPVSGSELTARVGENLVVAYLVYDSGNDIEDLMGECMGKLLSFHRYSSDIAEGMRALGKTSDGDLDLDRVWNSHGEEAAKRYLAKVRKDYSFRDVRERLNDAGIISWEGALSMLSDEIDVVSNWDRVEYENEMEEVLYQMWAEPEFFPGDPDAQVLACYEHGGQHWSLSGQGPQDRWDTSNFAGVWVPDSNLREELDTVAPTAARAFVRGVGKSYQLVHVLWADDEPTLVKLELYDDASALWGKARRIAESQKAQPPGKSHGAAPKWRKSTASSSSILTTTSSADGSTAVLSRPSISQEYGSMRTPAGGMWATGRKRHSRPSSLSQPARRPWELNMSSHLIKDFGLSLERLKDRYEEDEQHPVVRPADWRRAVRDRQTELGYWEFVHLKVAQYEAELDECNPYNQLGGW